MPKSFHFSSKFIRLDTKQDETERTAISSEFCLFLFYETENMQNRSEPFCETKEESEFCVESLWKKINEISFRRNRKKAKFRVESFRETKRNKK